MRKFKRGRRTLGSLAWKYLNQTRKRIMSLRVMRYVRRFLFRTVMYVAVRRLSNRDTPPIPALPRQILVFGDMGLGNFLMFTPALATLRRRYPAAEIVVLFFKARGAEVMAKGNPDIDRILTIDMPKRSGLLPFLRLIRECRRQKVSPDVIVSRWNGSPYVSLLTMYLNAPTRVGHVSSAGFKGYCDAVFNFPISMTEETHEVERNLDLIRALGAEPATRQMHMPVFPEHRDEATALTRDYGFDAGRLICLQTGSSKLQSWKRWREDKWAELATMLADLGYDLAFVGSKDEAAVADAIIAQARFGAGSVARNLCGKLSVNGTAAFLAEARGIVCNDSGLMHVAAAVGTPIIGLFGPTEYDRTRPFVDNCLVLRNPCQCNHGTLFDRKTLAKIESCSRPCLNDTAADQVRQHILEIMPIEAQRADAS